MFVNSLDINKTSSKLKTLHLSRLLLYISLFGSLIVKKNKKKSASANGRPCFPMPVGSHFKRMVPCQVWHDPFSPAHLGVGASPQWSEVVQPRWVESHARVQCVCFHTTRQKNICKKWEKGGVCVLQLFFLCCFVFLFHTRLQLQSCHKSKKVPCCCLLATPIWWSIVFTCIRIKWPHISLYRCTCWFLVRPNQPP